MTQTGDSLRADSVLTQSLHRLHTAFSLSPYLRVVCICVYECSPLHVCVHTHVDAEAQGCYC